MYAAAALAALMVASSASSASFLLAKRGGSPNQGKTAGSDAGAPTPPAANAAKPDGGTENAKPDPAAKKKLAVQSKTGGSLVGKAPASFSKSDASTPSKGGGPSSSGGGGVIFSVPKALALLNSRRAKEGLPPFSADTTLMNGAQRRANAGEFPHTLSWYSEAGACENLSVECAGSGDQAVEWAVYKLYDFERDNKNNATAPGSPCYAVIPTDQGHYKNFSNKVAACGGNKLGIGVAPLKKFNGGAPPSHMKTLVVFWVR
jgi:hypothetical protein